jgi:hypothetical protein
LKDLNKSYRNLKGENYTGYDEINGSSEEGIYIWLTFEDEEFEVCCYVNDSKAIEYIILVDEEAQKKGVSYGKIIFIDGKINYKEYSNLVNKATNVLIKEEYI